MSGVERRYRRLNGTWTDETNLLYIPKELAAALEALDLLDQRLDGGAEGGDGLGQHFEVVVRRSVPGGSAPTSGGNDRGLRFAERHVSPSVPGSATAIAEPLQDTLGDAAGANSSGASAALSFSAPSSPDVDGSVPTAPADVPPASAGVSSSSPV